MAAEIDKTGKGSKLDGVVSVTDAEGRLVERVNLAGGILNGEFTAWKPDGSVERKGSFKDGLLHGEMKDLRDGEHTLNFSEGKLHGEMLSSVNGVPAMRAMCKDGQRDGEMLLYEPDGKVSTKANFRKGKLEGELVKYAGGKVSMKALYKDGLLEGESLFYDPAGNVISRMHFHAGKINGLASWFGSDRSLVRISTYKEGLLNGKTTEYFPNGKPRKTSIYKDDVLEGEVSIYKENGKLKETQQYRNGKPVASGKK